ncbi:MAG TPA: response regulator [Candidatus Dormibacteraeota bacterium]|nr:response regulator [Candidatus Dormibacteraeota bacterium]
MKTLCVLQVEDTEEDVVLLRYAFQQAGIQSVLRAVPHGEAAMDYILGKGDFYDREAFPLPALILLDLKLPGMSGLELLGWVRSSSPIRMVPVIVLSSSSHRTDVESAYERCANAFVTKPSGIDELTELVEGLKIFWLKHTQFPAGSVNTAIRR